MKSKHVAVLSSSSSKQMRQTPENETDSTNTQVCSSENVQPVAGSSSSVASTSNTVDNYQAYSRQLVQSKIQLPVKKLTASQREKIDEQLMLLFIKEFQPFSIVEDTGFRAYTNALNVAY